jgi:hypothetical protein
MLLITIMMVLLSASVCALCCCLVYRWKKHDKESVTILQGEQKAITVAMRSDT